MSKRRDFGTVVRRSGSQQYYVRFYAGRRTSRRRYERRAGRTREIAKRKLRSVQTLLDEGMPIAQVLHAVFGDPLPDAKTFKECVDPYLKFVKESKRPSTHASYSYTLAMIAKLEWASSDLDAIEASVIARWLDGRRRAGRSSQTLNNYLVAISGLFRWAIERGLVAENPVRKLRWNPQGSGRETYLTATEARALVDAAQPHIKTLVVLALSTGMRRGEMLALRWCDVDFESRTVRVTADVSKSHRLRVIPMTDTLHAYLAEWSLARRTPREPTNLVFARSSGEPLAKATIRSHLRKAVQNCDAIPAEKKPRVTMHVLRHTAASLMVAGGRPIFDVAKILGHQDVKTTMRYAHFAPQAGRDTIETLGKMLDLDANATGETDGSVSEGLLRFG